MDPIGALFFTIFALILAAILAVLYKLWRTVEISNDGDLKDRTMTMLFSYADWFTLPVEAINAIQPERFFEKTISDEEAVARKKLILFMNSMEHMASFINMKIVDEKICKKVMRGAVVSSFSRLSSYILILRKVSNNSRVYIEFEALSRRWEES